MRQRGGELTIDKIMISTLVCNIMVVLFCVIIAVTIIGMIQNIVHEHNAEKRKIEQEQRDIEYHQKRMKD